MMSELEKSLMHAVKTINEDEMDYVGQMMLGSARVFAAGGAWIPLSYVQRILTHRRDYAGK